MRNLVILLLMCLFVYCHAQKRKIPNLTQTKWEYQVAEGFKDYILFDKEPFGYSKKKEDFNYRDKKGQYVEYSSELDYPYSGIYKVKNDTIYLTRIDLVSELPGITKTEIKSISKMILTENGLTKVFYKSRNGISWDEKWIKSPKVFFKRVK